MQVTYLVLFQLSKVRQSIIAHSFQSLPRVVNYSDVERRTHNSSQSEWNKDAPQVNLPKDGNVCKNRNLPRQLTKDYSCSTTCEQLNEKKKDKSRFCELESIIFCPERPFFYFSFLSNIYQNPSEKYRNDMKD